MNESLESVVNLLIFAANSEDKLRLGIKNELVHFVLLSTCSIFVANNFSVYGQAKDQIHQLLHR
jgi:hypothetical protein